MSEFYVSGSHGDLTVDAATGEVLERYERHGGDPAEYADIVRFDVDEWRNEYPDEALAGTSMDILDIGFWTTEGEYVEPVDEWREDMRRENQRTY